MGTTQVLRTTKDGNSGDKRWGPEGPEDQHMSQFCVKSVLKMSKLRSVTNIFWERNATHKYTGKLRDFGECVRVFKFRILENMQISIYMDAQQKKRKNKDISDDNLANMSGNNKQL